MHIALKNYTEATPTYEIESEEEKTQNNAAEEKD